MMRASRLFLLPALLFFVGGATGNSFPEISERARERVESKRPSRPEPHVDPHTEPDGAVAYQQLRRAAPPGVDPVAAHFAALARRAAMPVYSSRRGRYVDRENRPTAGWDRAAEGLGTWKALGPGNIGGRTRAMVIRPDKPGVMFAAGVSGGIWKTTNSGRRWRPVGDEMANIAVNALALDPNDPKVLYAGTGEGFFRETVRGTGLPLRGAGIFKSVDGGETWTRLAATRGKNFHWVNDLAVSPHDGDRVYAATRRGLFRSLDGGLSWTRILNPRVTGGCLDLAMRDDTAGDFLFASCGTFEPATVYRNRRAENDGGWEGVLAEPGMGRTSLAVAPSDPSVVYALAASNVPGPGGDFEQALLGVYRSTEDGEAGSWEARLTNETGRKIDRVLLHNPIIAFLDECGFQGPSSYFAMGWYVNVIAVDPGNADRVWTAGVDLFRSDDGGRSFNPVTYWWDDDGRPNFVHADHHGLVFHPRKPQTLFSLNDGGVFRTNNARGAVATDDGAVCRPGSSGVAWRALNRGYGVTQFYHGLPFPGDPDQFLGGAQDNGTLRGSTRSGFNGWARILGGDGGYSAIDPRDPRVIYASIQNGDVRKSENGGVSFVQVGNGIDDLVGDDDLRDFRGTRANFLFVSPLLMDGNAPDRLWLGGRRLWRTDNGAGEWAAASTRLAGEAKASALAVAEGNSDLVVAGSHNGWIFRTDRATRAEGTTVWASSRPRRGFVTSVAFDPSDPDVVYATYGGFGGKHVWRSGNGGANWKAIDGRGAGKLPKVPTHAIVVDPGDPERLYLGTDLGVFVSLDGGETWVVENTGFAAAVTESLSLSDVAGSAGGPYLFAFTHGRGAWRVAIQ